MVSSKKHSKRILNVASSFTIKVSGILRHPSRSEFPSFPGIVSSISFPVIVSAVSMGLDVFIYPMKIRIRVFVYFVTTTTENVQILPRPSYSEFVT
jgi:hypothetical protein